eukprot:NODE_56_length_25944_cov_0.235287.p4 type:complete len:761 gc:universal NODE_56_length_25944_cov_0.235287:23994-21712(-)
MRICVAEKPSIAKSVTQILSNNSYSTSDGWKWCKNFKFEIKSVPVIMTSVTGHVLDIEFQDSSLKRWESCSPITLMDASIKKSVNKDMLGISRNLESLSRYCTELIILTDNDREGEYIGWEIVHIMTQTKSIPVKRMRFSVVQPSDIWNAYNNLGVIDNLQVQAVDCRMELDLRIGAAFTRHLSLSLKRFTPENKFISYGSCQFPTLGFVVKRYKERNEFVSEMFYFISIKVFKNNISHIFSWQRKHLFSRCIVDAIYEHLLNKVALIAFVQKKPTSKWAPLPLTTVEMQKCGSRLLHISSAKIMKIAEGLYQKGIISYPRTETDQFQKNFNLKDLIKKQVSDSNYRDFANELLNTDLYRFPRCGNHNDKAHPPIHPTSNGSNLNGDDRRVFDFITRRFLACCSKDATGNSTTIHLSIEDEVFTASGLQILQRNYLRIYPFDTWKSVEVAEFTNGELVKEYSCTNGTGKTAAPQFLTEADLIGLMDKHGIGTDATMHDHISKIFTREYVMYNNKFIIPTSLGLALVEGLDAIPTSNSMPLLSEPELRAEMEKNLAEICTGSKPKSAVLVAMISKYKNVYNCMNQIDDLIQSIFQANIVQTINSNIENFDMETAGETTDSTRRKNNRNSNYFLADNINTNTESTRPNDFTKKNKVAKASAPNANYFSNNSYPKSEIRCDCGLIASEKKCQNGTNKNRVYYTCTKATKCKFFKWQDAENNHQAKNLTISGSNFKCFLCDDASHMANACPSKNKRSIKHKKFK